MENNSATMLITAFLLLIVGVSLVTVIASEEQLKTTKIAVGSESVAIRPLNASDIDPANQSYVANLPTAGSGWKSQDEDCYLSGFALSNGTDDGTLATDYHVTLQLGNFTLVDTEWGESHIGANNYTTARYYYCGDDYLADGWNRTVLDLIAGFFAIALLLIAVALFYKIGQREGWIGSI